MFVHVASDGAWRQGAVCVFSCTGNEGYIFKYSLSFSILDILTFFKLIFALGITCKTLCIQ